MSFEEEMEGLNNALVRVPIEGKFLPDEDSIRIEETRVENEQTRQKDLDTALKRMLKSDGLTYFMESQGVRVLLAVNRIDGKVWLNKDGEITVERNNANKTTYTYELQKRKGFRKHGTLDTKPFEEDGIFMMTGTTYYKPGEVLKGRGPLAYEYAQGALKDITAADVAENVKIQVENVLNGRKQMEGLFD